MKLTTKSRYGVRAIFDIAYHAGDAPAQIKDISERQRISPRYLEQIFQSLKKAGLLGSKRGPRGGYTLLKEPKDITLYEIIACTEGPIELVFCVGENSEGELCAVPVCEQKEYCAASPIWKEVGERMADILSHTTIQDLCERAEEIGIEPKFSSGLMYYI
jgi:Rrf2 family protein